MPNSTTKVEHVEEARVILKAASEEPAEEVQPIAIAEAQVHASLAIAEELRGIGEALGRPKVNAGDLTRHILDALDQPADDPSDAEATFMQRRIEQAIRGWFDV